MKKLYNQEDLNFLSKLIRQERLKLVEPSEEVKKSYLEKSGNSLKSAKLLINNNLYENSVSMSYYAMYNSLTALLYKIGIKCENHTGSIILLKTLLKKEDLYKPIFVAKKERIDKQYYVTGKDDYEVNKESTQEMIKIAEDFIIEIKLLIKNIDNNKIKEYRKEFAEMVNRKI